jgi:hypothetical protein
MLRGVLFVAMAMALASCATPNFTREDVAANAAGGNAIIIMGAENYGQNNGCYGVAMTFANVATRKLYHFSVPNDDSSIMPVPPGTYVIYDGHCGASLAGATMTYPMFRRWFPPFEVKSGEVRYIGDLNVHQVDVTLELSNLQRTANWGLGLGIGERKYLAYEFFDKSQAHVAYLTRKHPELLARFAYAPLVARFSKDEFKETILAAYAPNPDGSSLTAQEIDARVLRGLQALKPLPETSALN